MRNYLLSIGVMTGNSLDAADVVLTRFDEDGGIQDLIAHSLPSPESLTSQLRQLRNVINECRADMNLALTKLDAHVNTQSTFNDIQNEYIHFVARAIKELIQLAKQNSQLASTYNLEAIDLIGFHGQTCAHFPPSIAKTNDPAIVYTCQIGDGQQLANLTGITVVYDFRSDDIMNGGEGAPLAPVHHEHLSRQLKQKNQFPIAFCNAGNTGNFTIVSIDQTNNLAIAGWDAGPFNNYPDKLVQKERGEDCDRDGRYGTEGTVNSQLLKILFDTAVITSDGQNFLNQLPPKSSDPQWYKLIPELLGDKPVNGQILNFADRLRTAEYFSAYIYVWAFTMLPENIQLPSHYALCGGGWNNPIVRQHFTALMQGDFKNNPVLPEHRTAFDHWQARLTASGNQQVFVDFADHYGFDGTAMEARIFADAAVRRIKGEPFTKTTTTGARKDTICGIIRFPASNKANATPTLLAWLTKYNSLNLTPDNPALYDSRWGRAVAGWHTK